MAMSPGAKSPTSPNDIGTERATPADAARVRTIRLRALDDSPEAFSSTLAWEQGRPLQWWRQRLENQYAVTVLGIHRNHDAGIAVCLKLDDVPDSAGLFSFWVAPQSRGSGLADRLLSTAIAWATSQDFEYLVLNVGDHNHAAIRLYMRHGFTATGKVGQLPEPRQHITERELRVRLRST